MDVVCVACGAVTTESVYRIQRLQQLTCRACGDVVDLSSDAVRREADRAEAEFEAMEGSFSTSRLPRGCSSGFVTGSHGRPHVVPLRQGGHLSGLIPCRARAVHGAA
jgi:hypothetical protein